MPEYRIIVRSMEPNAHGVVILDAILERGVLENRRIVWSEVRNGHRSIEIDHREVMMVLNCGPDENKMRTAVKKLVYQKARDWQAVVDGDDAYALLSELLPDLPLTINVQPSE
jgi:hypothetical protein